MEKQTTKYELLSTRSDNEPASIIDYKVFIDMNYNINKISVTYEGIEHKEWAATTLRVRGVPDKDEMIRFLIHTEYSIDDEIALINKGADNEEYLSYIRRRDELKALATGLYLEYKAQR